MVDSQTLAAKSLSSQRKLMLFDLSINGHHPTYIQHLIRYWGERQFSSDLDIVVSPKFLQHHSDVVDLAQQYNHRQICFVPISAAEEAILKSRRSGLERLKRVFQEWDLLCRYAQQLRSDHCLMLYLDTCQRPLAFASPPPCPVSGIYFRPTFHYQDFTHHRLSWRDRVQQFQEKWLLQRVLKNPQFKTIFSLDPFAVKYIERLNKKVEVVALPDPILETTVSEFQVTHLKQRLGISDGKKVFLLFGALNGRKGIYELLDAVALLRADVSEQLSLVLVGQANSQDQPQLVAKIAQLQATEPIEIIYRFEFIPEVEVPIYFGLADVVLAPYQRHVGMSGILLQAAAARKPVLSSNYGLMGEMVKRYELGLAIDAAQPSEIALGIQHLLSHSPEHYGNRERMQQFAQENSAERFASVIFEHI